MNNWIEVCEVINLLNKTIRKTVSNTINAYDSTTDSAGSVLEYLTGVIDCADCLEKVLSDAYEKSEG